MHQECMRCLENLDLSAVGLLLDTQWNILRAALCMLHSDEKSTSYKIVSDSNAALCSFIAPSSQSRFRGNSHVQFFC